MESKNVTNSVGLLPNYFKKVGCAVIGFTLLSMLSAKIFNDTMSTSLRVSIRDVLPSIFILGLFFVAWSKDKMEDELTLFIRLKAMSWAFGWGVLSVIIAPVVDVLMVESFRVVASRQLVLSMLLVFLVVFYLYKRAR